MSSYLPSLPSSFLSLRQAPIVDDAPLSALPKEEEKALDDLQGRFPELFTSADSPLHEEDPWRTLPSTSTTYIFLRFIRYHLLKACAAEKHVRSVISWRTKNMPWRHDRVKCATCAAGFPMIVFDFCGKNDCGLLFTPASRYIRSLADHSLQPNALLSFYEHCLYAPDGPRMTGGVLIVDFHNLAMQNVDLIATRIAIKEFRAHYPELFTKIIFFNYPTWIYGVWKVVKPCLDARTIAKVVWVSEADNLTSILCEYFEMDAVPVWLGGKRPTGELKMLNGEAFSEDDCHRVFHPVPAAHLKCESGNQQ